MPIRDEFVESILLAPSERAVVDVLFEAAGQFPIEHSTPEGTYRLGTPLVGAEPAAPSFAAAFFALRRGRELEALRMEIAGDFDREPDKTLVLVGEMPGMNNMPGMKHVGGHLHAEEIEWEDTMPLHNRMSHPGNMFWKIVDLATGQANHDIDWVFESGPRVKIRIANPTDFDHPMQHPFHFHRQRFLVLRRDGRINDNLEGYGAGQDRQNRRHPPGHEQPRLLDGSLPYRRAHRGRDDVQLPGEGR